MTTTTLPTYFISHGGGPWPWMKDQTNGAYDRLEASLTEMPQQIGMTPKAVLVISGHWEESDLTVMSSANPPVIYDYSGFPEHTYRIKYAAPGSPQIAERVRGLIEGAGFAAHLDTTRGYDHGTFAPLAVNYPDADVPVLQLSLRRGAAWPMIDQTIGQAQAAASGVRGSLTQDAAGQLDARIKTIKSARQKHDRPKLALSSIETYRVLVSAVTDNAKVPTEVSLLDYAGFRYDANLKANPIGWEDMARAVSFARTTWDALSPRAKASPVATRFEKTLTDMDNAVVQRSKSLAASSVKTELDLVDQLENFFSAS